MRPILLNILKLNVLLFFDQVIKEFTRTLVSSPGRTMFMPQKESRLKLNGMN